MSLVAVVCSPDRAIFWSDGFVVNAENRPIRTDVSKLFRLPGGQILAAVGDADGFHFAQSLAHVPMLTLAAWEHVKLFCRQNPHCNSCFYLAGRVGDRLSVKNAFFTGRGFDAVEDDFDSGRAGLFVGIDGAFEDRERYGGEIRRIGALTDFDAAARAMQELFETIRAENPSRIGGDTFYERISSEPIVVLRDQSSYARVVAAALSSGSINLGASSGWVNKTTDYLPDGSDFLRMPSPPALSGGSNASLSQSGTSTAIDVAAATFYFGNIVINTNSGSVDPGAYGTWYVYFDLSAFESGTISPTYHASSSESIVTENPYRVEVGGITTTSSGGGTYKPPNCFSGDVRVKTPNGFVRFDDLPPGCEIVNETGTHRALLIRHDDSEEPMREMPGGGLVTERHMMKRKSEWVRAGDVFPEKAPIAKRSVYNLHVITTRAEDRHFVLENGFVAHNMKDF